MAFRAVAGDRLLGSMRGLSAGRKAVHQQVFSRLPGRQLHIAATAAPHVPVQASPAPNKYAILQLGGVRQMLQEGLLYTCPKHCLLQEQHQQHAQFSTAPTAAGNGTGDQPQPQPQQQAEHASTEQHQRSFYLSNVLGLHNGEQFTWGTPYLPNTLVEVEVVEEFQGPTPTSVTAATVASGPDSSMMTIYRVKHIKAAQ